MQKTKTKGSVAVHTSKAPTPKRAGVVKAKSDKSNTIKKGKKKSPKQIEQERTTAAKEIFLNELLNKNVCGNISIAASRAGIDRSTVYEWKNSDPDFKEKLKEAQSEARNVRADMAEGALLRLIADGNVTAIIFTLKNDRPNKWRDRIEHTGKKGESIKMEAPGLASWLLGLKAEEEKKNPKRKKNATK